ncbi:MAG: hypothetical protein ACXADY_23015 [Candidatus Hodarchaeales archaeon]
MSRGNPEETDLILLRKISLYDRPVALKELAKALDWNAGKVDGSIKRLQTQGKIATVKVVPPKGHRQRWAGLSKRKYYWNTFFQKKIVNDQNILVDDPLKIFDGFNVTDTTMRENQLDPDLLQVLDEFHVRINSMAEKQGLPSSKILRNLLTDGLDKNTPFFKELIKVFTEVYRETENPILRNMIYKAQQSIQT